MSVSPIWKFNKNLYMNKLKLAAEEMAKDNKSSAISKQSQRDSLPNIKARISNSNKDSAIIKMINSASERTISEIKDTVKKMENFSEQKPPIICHTTREKKPSISYSSVMSDLLKFKVEEKRPQKLADKVTCSLEWDRNLKNIIGQYTENRNTSSTLIT